MMHQVLIVSDSHGLTEPLLDIQQRHQVEHLIHCGDSELDVDNPMLERYYKVTGNCDIDARFPEEQVVEIGGLYFLVVHGHLHGVKQNLSTLSYRAQELGAQVACYGHTHIAHSTQRGGQLLINPGSIRAPRTRLEKTYCVVTWEQTDNIELTFYTLEGDVVEDLSFKVSL